MSQRTGHSAPSILDERELWRFVASRLDAMCEQDRKEWEPLVATLRERDRMTVQALKLAESGLKMMARNVRRMEAEKERLSASFRTPIGPGAANHVRMDPQPGSGGCMWIS